MSQRTLYFVKDSRTGLARLYTKIPPERNPGKEDHIWIPRSVVEHTSKTGNTHIVTLPDWFLTKENL